MPILVITPRPTPVGFTATAEHTVSHSESALVADFGSIPPEINSARMYAGPGPDSLLAAAATWDGLAADLYEAAGSHHAVASQLTTESWRGPASVTMMAATTPYLAWLRDTAALAARTAQHARVAVAAYEAARAMTVPPSVVATNRAQSAMLAGANALGLDTHALAANEAQYREMWAQDSTAMYMYAETSANASNITPFLMPPGTVGTPGLAKVPALPATGSVGSVGSVAMTATLGKAAAVGGLSAPRTWLTAASLRGSAAAAPNGWTATPIDTPQFVPMMPVATTAGDGAVGYVPKSQPGVRTVIRMRS